MKMGTKKTKLVCLILVATLFVVWAGIFVFKTSFVTFDGQRHFCLFDDAMISMRYAWNLSHGNGLVWNIGVRTEGFTNMLMTLIMSLATLIFSKGGAVLSIQILGILFMLAIAFFSMKTGDALLKKSDIGHPPYLSVFFFLGGLIYYPLVYWSLIGMETGLLAALLLASVWISISIDGKHRFVPLLGVLLGLAFWTRPDAAVPIVLILFHRVAGLFRIKGWLNIALKEIGIVLLFAIGISLFRLGYYGSFLPNTVALKLGGLPLMYRIENGLGFIEPFLRNQWILLIAAAIGVAIHLNRHTVLLLLLIVTSIGYQIYVGGDPWRYWRMTAPFMPLVFLLIVVETVTLTRLLARLVRPIQKRQPLVEGLVTVLVFSLLAIRANTTFKDEISFKVLPYMVEFNHATVSVAMALNEVTTPNASIGVLWAGSVPYYTDLRAIDFLGKTDKYIASLPPDTSGKVAFRGMNSVPGHNKYDLNYSVKKLKPTYVQEAKWGRDNVVEFLKKEYEGIRYKGVPLMLKRNSAEVKWEIARNAKAPSKHVGPIDAGRETQTDE